MRFKKVYIEITNRCNLDCSFCPKCKRQLAYMKEDAFRYILKSIKPYTKYIYFHLMGEPLLHPELESFLALAKEDEFKVNLTTNGTLLPKVKDILLNAPALRQINISVHSFEANEGGRTIEAYLENIMDFIKQAQEKSQVICSLRLWNLDSGRYKGDNALNKSILEVVEEKFALEYDLGKVLQEKKGVKLSDRVYINTAEKFEWATMNKETTSENRFCYGLRDQIGVLVDGTVVPCCLDNDGNIPLGNLFITPLEDILNSERAQAIYDGFSKRHAVEALCKRCHFKADQI